MKYIPLTEHLKKVTTSAYPMTFAEIEQVVGNRLPESARRYRAWWSNNPDNSVMTKAWLDAGWYSSDVDMKEKRLIFRRRKGKPEAMDTGVSHAPQAHQFSFSGLPKEVLDILRIKAEIRRVTVEQYAASVLTGAAQLSAQERLQLADAIRAQGPRLEGIDVPGMIRDDRDRS